VASDELTELQQIVERFGSKAVEEDSGLRSNKTMKPGRLARKVWESTGGIRSSVLGRNIGPPGFEAPIVGRAGPQGIHANAIMNWVDDLGIPPEQQDEIYNAYSSRKNFNERMGFTTRNERFISREEASRRARERAPGLSESFEEHSGGMQADRNVRKREIGAEALLGEERRAPGAEGERIKVKRASALEQLRKLEVEENDLRRKNVVSRKGNLKIVKIEKQPRLNKSPLSFTERYRAAETQAERRQIITQRLKDISARKQVLRKAIAGAPTKTGALATKARIAQGKAGYGDITNMTERSPALKAGEPLIPNEPLHVKAERLAQETAAAEEAARVRVNSPVGGGRLARLARKFGRGGMKALAPLGGVLMEPFATAEAVEDMMSGDESGGLAAVEHFMGLPKGITGRGLTPREKHNMVLPWYDPRRREGGI